MVQASTNSDAQKMKSNFSKFARVAIMLCALVFLGGDMLFAQQSSRRKIYGRVAPSPSQRLRAEAAAEFDSKRDFDFYAGRIVRKNGEYVIVQMALHSKIAGRAPIYYACDVKMRPVSILSPSGINHRACVAFKIERGDASVGDVVMVKFPAPERDEKAK